MIRGVVPTCILLKVRRYGPTYLHGNDHVEHDEDNYEVVKTLYQCSAETERV